MKIINHTENDVTTVVIDGRIETATAPEFESSLLSIMESSKELILDFSKVEYVSSAGLRVLLTAQKAMNAKQGKMTILHPNEVVNEVFNITGFNTILNIEM